MQVQQKATPSASIIKQDQFEATRKWRLALKKFYEGLPLLTHRRQLRAYSETFTGKDAVDFAERIFPTVFSKCCDRESARSLLEKFLSFGYITNVRGESSKTFFDNATLYRFCNERVTQMLRKEQEDESNRRRSTLLKRSSSVRDRDATNHTERFQSDNFLSSRANDTNLKELSSNMAKLNGRLSISCQDISTIEKQNNLSAAKKSFGAGMLSNLVSIGRASATLFSLNRSNSDSARARQQRRCNAISTNSKSLCDSVLREKCTNRVGVEMECESMGLTNNKMCGISQSVFKTAPSSCTTTVKFLPQNIVRHRTATASQSLISAQCQATNIVFTEADEFRFWRSALVNWFEQFTSCNNVDRFFPSNFSGADVRWNCRRINDSTGIVQRLPEHNGELHHDLVHSLRRLAQWTGTNHLNEAVGEPFGLFTLVKVHLEKVAPIIPQEQAECLLNVFDHFSRFNADGTKKSRPDELRVDRRLCFSLRLCALTFSPQLLRNLQILCKFIRQFCFNDKLMQENCWETDLQTTEGERTVNVATDRTERRRDHVLRVLCEFFFPQKYRGNSTCPKAFLLFKLLLENAAQCLIQTPKWLAEEVQRQIKEFVSAGHAQPNISPNDRVLPANAYCDRIGRKEYEAQSKDADRHLLGLLDQILGNENLNPFQRSDQLRKFRLAYPSIYAKRFPSFQGRSLPPTTHHHSSQKKIVDFG